MSINETFYPQQIGKSARQSSSGQDIRTKIADEAIDAGKAVQLVDGDEDRVEVFDGTGTVYGIARYSTQADQDFRREDDARDRAEYQEDDPVAIQRPGSDNDVIVEFEEDADTLGEQVVVDEDTGNFRPDSTDEDDVTELDNASVAATTITNDDVEIGAIRTRPIETN